MPTDAQINANRENAKKSTGPGENGKKISRMNAVKHNFTGQTFIVHEHERDAYKNHFARFREDFKPVGCAEEHLVQSLADLSWSAQKIRAITNDRIVLTGARPTINPNSSLTPETETAVAEAQNAEDLSRQIERYSIYEQRKMRMFNTALKDLTRIQAERKAKEQADLELAIALRKDDLANREPGEPAWQPSENGFVFSLDELDRQIAFQKRLDRIKLPKKIAA
jgi:hypothetical protein